MARCGRGKWHDGKGGKRLAARKKTQSVRRINVFMTSDTGQEGAANRTANETTKAIGADAAAKDGPARGRPGRT